MSRGSGGGRGTRHAAGRAGAAASLPRHPAPDRAGRDRLPRAGLGLGAARRVLIGAGALTGIGGEDRPTGPAGPRLATTGVRRLAPVTSRRPRAGAAGRRGRSGTGTSPPRSGPGRAGRLGRRPRRRLRRGLRPREPIRWRAIAPAPIPARCEPAIGLDGPGSPRLGPGLPADPRALARPVPPRHGRRRLRPGRRPVALAASRTARSTAGSMIDVGLDRDRVGCRQPRRADRRPRAGERPVEDAGLRPPPLHLHRRAVDRPRGPGPGYRRPGGGPVHGRRLLPPLGGGARSCSQPVADTPPAAAGTGRHRRLGRAAAHRLGPEPPHRRPRPERWDRLGTAAGRPGHLHRLHPAGGPAGRRGLRRAVRAGRVYRPSTGAWERIPHPQSLAEPPVWTGQDALFWVGRFAGSADGVWLYRPQG